MGGTHTGEKDRFIYRSIPAATFSPVFVTRVAKTKNIIKFKWGQPMAWWNFGANLCSVTCSNFRLCFSGSI